jgi:aminoglycoside phosphotransferase (APT) family kinase protein
VWVHGDVAASNLLLAGGALHAVIDFGCAAVGDPACDLVMAWTFAARRFGWHYSPRQVIDRVIVDRGPPTGH